MVWVLSPVDEASGFRPFYFLAAREYTIGRKDGDIVIPNEASISRLHAKLIVKDPPPWLPHSQKAVPRPEVWLKDLSKVGTFLNKTTGSSPVSAEENGEAFLHEGVIITFGLARVTFRLTFLPWVVCLSSALDANVKATATHAAKLAGVYVVEEWVEACSHLVERDGGLATPVTWAAVAARKPIVTVQWLQAVAARQSVGVPLPNPASFSPLLRATPDSGGVPVATCDARATLFSGSTFYLARTAKYIKQLEGLLRAAGAFVEFITNAKLAGARNTDVLVVPSSTNGTEASWLAEAQTTSVKGMRRAVEDRLLAAVLSAQLDWPSILETSEPAASASTQDTADGGNGNDTELQSVDSQWMSSARVQVTQARVVIADIAPLPETAGGPSMVVDPSIGQSQQRASRRSSRSETIVTAARPPQPRVEEEARAATLGTATQTQEPSTDPALPSIAVSSQADIVFKPLVVKSFPAPAPSRPQASAPGCRSGSGPPNFKAFRKMQRGGEQRMIVVPFAREPYREVEGLRPEVEAYVRSESKRKEAERMSDDLFNADKLKRQKAASYSVPDDSEMPPPRPPRAKR